jgi:hypothetical protein
MEEQRADIAFSKTAELLREILALTPEKPLYGHRSGRRERTHWVAFIKGFGEAASG